MVKYIISLALIFSICFTYGCVPAVMEKVKLQQIELEATPLFNPPIQIVKPEKPNPIFLDGDFNQTDSSDNLEYFAFDKKEFVKIIQLSQSFDILDQLTYLYVGMINTEINTNNDLREMLARKDIVAQHFADLYINEENLRLQENNQHEKTKIFDKIIIFVQTGIILALVL